MARRPRHRAKRWLLRSLVCLQALSLALAPCIGYANPLGGTVVQGNAAIANSGSTLTVTQSTSRAIINWQGFSINAGETTRFVQPGADAAILNRVTGTDPSLLLGTLQANGQVFLINPHGIVVGPNANINVGALTLSTLNVGDKEFMLHRPGGELNFRGDSQASVINHGRIRAIEGNIHLIGARVANYGTLSAPNGTVGMAAGQDVRLVDSAHPQLVVRPTAKSLGGTGVHNSGTIEGLQAQLVAAHGNVYALAINNEGTVRANTVVREGGRIMLRASGGTIRNSGDLIAKGEAGAGGQVTVDASNGGRVELAGNVDASGATGGGQVEITVGNVEMNAAVKADAINSGDGGTVLVRAEGTADFDGTISARGGPQAGDGGFVEVSGSRLLLSGRVFTNAPAGRTGTFLLDPGEFDVNAGVGPATVNSIGADTLTGSGYLADNNVVIATDGASPGNGEIRVNADVIWNTPTSLTLLAHGNIRANANIQNGAGTAAGSGGNVNLVAGWDGATQAPGSAGANPGAAFDFAQIIAAGAYGDTTYGGSVYIGSGTQTTGIAVGSRFGATNVAAHDLDILASTSTTDSFAQLGFTTDHTMAGYLIDSPITVNVSGDINATGGHYRSYAQVGHGGGLLATVVNPAGGSYNGDIEITALGDLTFKGGNAYGYAQLGHGGHRAEGNHSGAMTIKRAKDLTFTGGRGVVAYAQLGHGGSDAVGNATGDITIVQTNDLTFLGGSSSHTYAQLGHGGDDADGQQSGAVTITQGRNLTLVGGDFGAYAQVGHGNAAGNITGNRHGDIYIRLTGETSLVNGTGTPSTTLNPWFIGHYGGASNANVTLITGTLDYSSTTTGTQVTLNQDFADKAVRMLVGGHVTIGATNGTSGPAGGMLVTGTFDYGRGVTPRNNVSFLSTTDVRFAASVQNAYGSLAGDGGQVNVVAGWDGATGVASPLDMALIFATPTSYGNSAGSVYIGDGAQTTGIAVGSRFGATNVAAHDLHITASTTTDEAFAQLGFRTDEEHFDYLIDSPITVHLTGGIAATGGADSAFAQVGHGGGFLGGGRFNGDIEITALGNLSFHGGSGWMAYGQLGHGGWYASGNHSGDVTITNAEDLSFTGGAGSHAYAQLGHGGKGAKGDHNGAITIVRANNLEFTGGGGLAYAQLGHGGSVADGDHSGAITIVDANDLVFVAGAGSAYAQLGHGSFNWSSPGTCSGAITISRANDLTFVGGNGENAFAQLGHGGYEADGDYSGDVTIESARDLTFTAGNSYGTYAQLGHGGHRNSGDITGNVTITRARDLAFTGGGASYAYAQLGHGGSYASGDHSGNVTIVEANDLIFAAGGAYGAYGVYAQLGHGGLEADGNNSGSIALVQVNDVTVTGGKYYYCYAQLGHGGFRTEGNHRGNVTIGQANDLLFTSGVGQYCYVQLGHGGHEADGDHSGDLAIVRARDVTFARPADYPLGPANYSYAQLGHGGHNMYGSLSGAISIGTVRDLTFMGGSRDAAYAQLGHGGYRARSTHEGNITIEVARDVRFSGGGGAGAYTQLGHGGYGGNQDQSGAITIGHVHGLAFAGGYGTDSYAQLGHGGNQAVGNHSGDITITQANDLAFSGRRVGAYAQLGHGGTVAVGNHSGDITIAQANDLTFTGGESSSYAQLGHGGWRAQGNHSGDVTIAQVHDVTFTGHMTAAYAQLGHGGYDADGNHSGDISIDQAHDLTFGGGCRYDAYAQLGHGGFAAGGNHGGTIAIGLAHDLTFTAGSARSYAHLGHGGAHVTGDLSGAVTIGQAHDLVFAAGDVLQSHAQLGHGGYACSGDHEGAVTVWATGSLTFTAGTGDDAYAQLGHGDAAQSTVGTRHGDIDVRAFGSVSLVGSEANPARIGHATRTAGAISGNVLVAVDQADPLADGGGRLVMNAYSAIDMGGLPNEVRIFDSRRDGPSPHAIEDGAVFNGVVYNSAGTPGTINGTWTPGAEFVTWDHEQWGPGAATYTTADLGNPALPYHGPFTFYFVGPAKSPIPNLTPEVRWQVFITIADMFNRFVSFPPMPQGPYTASYGQPGEGPPECILWLNSAQLFGLFAQPQEEPSVD